ncbi:MAG: FHA domain-containing protein [Actinomycetota bacterium]|nr:FHA domain-containing protein [Actinomycetota bacterium]
MTEDSERAPGQPDPQVEVESDPTVVYVPIQDRADHPLTREEAGSVEGFTGFALVIERGPQTGMTYLLPSGNTTIGRHPESDIFLNDVTISRQHCRFVLGEGKLAVEDSGSTNGTYVNEVRVDEAELRAGDEVVVGRFHFLVAHGDA